MLSQDTFPEDMEAMDDMVVMEEAMQDMEVVAEAMEDTEVMVAIMDEFFLYLHLYDKRPEK